MTQRDFANDAACAAGTVGAGVLVHLWLLPRVPPLLSLSLAALVMLALAYGWLALRKGWE